jgi:hypothetical protein
MANERRLISADALKEHLKSYTGMFTDKIGFAVSLGAVLWGIDAAPKVDAVEVVHGRWEYADPVSPNCFCSVCKYDAPWDDFGDYHSVRTNYCPNCGADMREPQVEE